MLMHRLKQFIKQLLRSKTIWIAYSGGMDSHVLLHALSMLRNEHPNLNLKAIHIHHGLLPHADQWSEHCKKVCKDLAVPCETVKVDVQPQAGESVEAVAREARYKAFKDLIQKDDVLVTAHHQDDQAETCLLQFFRGAGIKGLSAMASLTEFDRGFLLRPFLYVARSQIEAYAKQHKLYWIEDSSNEDSRFTRNFLRHQVMPLLHERWPNLNETIMRVTQHAAEADELLSEMAQEVLQKIVGSQPNTLSVKELKTLHKLQQKNVLRYWIYSQGYLLPQAKQLEHVLKDIVCGREDAKGCVQWSGAEVRRYQNDLYIMSPIEPFDDSVTLQWNYQEPLKLPGNLGILRAERVVGEGVDASKISDKLEVRFRSGGETCRLPNREGTHTLKKLFQEWKIPPWQRNRIPLIYADNQLVAIVGYAVCEGFVVEKDQQGLVIERK